MADVDDAIAQTAVALNEDAKAARKSPAKARKAEQEKLESLTAGDDQVDDDSIDAVGNGEGGEPLPPATNEEREAPALDLSEEAHTTAIDEMEAAATDYQIDERQLVPDVRDFLLEQIKRRPKPWSATSNAEQRDVAAACEHAAVELIRKVVEAAAANPASNPIRCLLIGYSDKGDDIKVDMKVKALSTEETTKAIVALHQAKGKHVLVTVASVDDYRGEGREPALDADEPDLNFEAGGDPAFDPPADDSDLAGDDKITAAGDLMRSGCQTLVEGKGLREIRVDLAKGWVQWADVPADAETIGELDWVDLREATPEELAAERERKADFAD